MSTRCRACSSPFKKSPFHPKQTFCSNRCYKRTYARIQRGWKPREERKCVVCSTAFMPPTFHPRARTCSRKCSKHLGYIKHRPDYLRTIALWVKKNREHVNAYSKNYRKKSPEKSAARSAVGYALRTGILVRPKKCSKCGKRCKPQAHHHKGYGKKLDVIWFCRTCHVAAHHEEQVSA